MRYLVLILSLLISTTVWAQTSTQTKSTTKSDKIGLTVDEVIQINNGLGALDCGNKLVKDGSRESIICEPYKWSAGMIWQIATAQKRARDVLTEYNRLRDLEISKLPRKPDGQPTEEAAAQFSVKMRGLLDADAKTAIEKFKREQLEPMNLPPSIVSLLLPIIE